MSTGRKISVRRIVQTLVTLIAVTGCAVALVSADKVQSLRTVKDIQIHVRNSGIVNFVSEDDVRQMLFSNRHIDPLKLKMAKLDIHGMENIIRSNPWTSDAQVCVDNNRVLHIFVTQRIPVVRVFEKDGSSYYLDTARQTMPLSAEYVHYTTVVTNVPVLHADSTADIIKGKLVWMAQYIAHHTFWNAQIAQVVMNSEKSFELIPVLGKQRILIGDTAHLNDKLTNLLSFYNQVQNKVGWDRYRILDVRYANQVVASPSLPWKIPADRSLSSMSWVKAIMDAAPKDKIEADPDTVAMAGAPPAPVPPPQAPPPVRKQPTASPPKQAALQKKPTEKKKTKTTTPIPKKPVIKQPKHITTTNKPKPAAKKVHHN